MLDQIRSLFKRIGGAEAEQKQREAMVDLLIWTMYADNVLSLPENDKIDQLTAEMPWDSTIPAQQYMLTSIARVRDAVEDSGASEALLEDIYKRLGSDAMRRRTYEACRDLAHADGEMAATEMHFLNTVKSRFKIDQDV